MNSIVHICSKPPIEAKDGGSKAILQLHQILKELPFSVTSIVFYSHKHPVEKSNYTSGTLFLKTPVKSGLSAVFGSTLKKTSLITERHFSAQHVQTIQDFCNQAQIVIFDGLIASSYLPFISSSAKKIYRSHNIEYSTYYSLAQELSPLKKLSYSLASKQLKNFELSIIKSSDYIWNIAPEDLSFFKAINPYSINIPFCVSGGPQTNATTTIQQKSIGLLAAFDWLPNYTAIQECVSELDPTLKQENIQFVIAGKASDSLKFNSNNITVLGELNNLNDFYSQVQVVINPVKTGGGLKIKTLEAMQFGKPVIGFQEAFRGHDCTQIPNAKFQIHTSYNSLKLAIKELFNSNERIKKIGSENKSYVHSNFNYEKTKLSILQNLNLLAK